MTKTTTGPVCFIETNTCGPGSDPRSAAPESRGKRTAYWERSMAPASEDPPRSTLPLRIPKRSFFPRKELVLTPPLFLKTFGFQKKILYVVLASRIFLQSTFPIHVFLSLTKGNSRLFQWHVLPRKTFLKDRDYFLCSAE